MSHKKTVIIDSGYHPRPFQKILHAKLKRFSVIVCHRRFGKSYFSLQHMIDRGLKNKLVRPRYIYVAPTLREGRRIAWDYLKAFTAMYPGVTFNEQELRIDIPLDNSGVNTLRFQILGADNPTSLKGAYYDGVILDEFASMDPSTFSEAIRPALSDRKGWAIFIGTPRGKNSFWEMYEYAMKSGDPEWFGALYKASETKVVDDSELASARRTMAPDEYEQEYECSFVVSSVGSFYGAQMGAAVAEGRVGDYPADPNLAVDLYYDLGMDDAMSVWFIQSFRMKHRVVYYREFHGEGLPQMAPQLETLRRDQGWTFGKHVFPWDLAVREIGTGKSRKEVAESLGLTPLYVAPKLPVMDGITQVRSILQDCYFDSAGCASRAVGEVGGLDALIEYKKKYDEKNKVWLGEPNHNRYSHGADAFRTFAVSHDLTRPVRKDLPRAPARSYSVFGRRN